MNVSAEPIHSGHGESIVPHGDGTYDGLHFKNCTLGRDPLIQLTMRGAKPGLTAHFRDGTVVGSKAATGAVAFGGEPRTNRTDNVINHSMHDSRRLR